MNVSNLTERLWSKEERIQERIASYLGHSPRQANHAGGEVSDSNGNIGPAPLSRSSLRPSRLHAMMILDAALVYALTFIPLHRALGNAVAVLCVLPAAVVGWYLGLRAGLVAGLLTFPLNTLLLNLAGLPGWEAVIQAGSVPACTVAVVVGVLVGRLRDLGEQVKQELIQHERTQAALREIEARNRALLVETQRHLKEQIALREVSTAVSSTVDLDEILAEITQKTARIVGSDSCAISRWDSENNTLLLLAEYIAGEGVIPNGHFKDVGQGLDLADYPATGLVLREHFPLIVYVDDPAADEAERRLLRASERDGVLMVPMLYKEQAIGLMQLHVENRGRHQFCDEDVTLCQALANQAAVAMENARLYEEERRHAADMVALYTISRMATRSLVLEDILSQALSSALTLLEFEAGLISLADPIDGKLHLVVEHSLPSILSRGYQRHQLVDTLCAYAHNRGERLILSDFEQEVPETIGKIATEMPGMGLRACACIPLIHQDRSFGTLTLFTHQPRTFSTSEITLLETIGHQLATAVANAQLFQTIAGERSRLQSLIASSHNGIILVGTDLRMLVTNAPALEFLRLPGCPEDWSNRPLQDALAALRHRAPDVVRTALAEIRRIQKGDESPGEGEHELSPRAVHWLNLPVMVDTTPLGRLVVLRDVTEERLLAQMREDLTHTMVHDLRNPVNIISGSLELLECCDDNLSDHQHAIVALARESTQRVLKLVNNILDVSRLESGQMPLECEPVCLDDLIDEVMRVQTPLALDKDLRLESDVPPTLPLAWADPWLTERVLQNLIDNAIRFTPNGGLVRVRAGRMDKKTTRRENGNGNDVAYLYVSVSDNGAGISSELQSRLFQKFVTGGRQGTGSGLGLTFCKLAVEAQNGCIWVESAGPPPGNELAPGTTFTFTLPVASESSIAELEEQNTV
jgi:NtrC-family two-component system sensor histidine kinase KinB